MVRAEVAEEIQFVTLTTDIVKEKLRRVLEDPKYQQNMKKRSKRFRDQPERPIERAIWWTNYILRNPNPEHLQSPVRKLGHFRGNSGDIIGLGILTIVIILFVLFKVVCLCVRKDNNVKLKKQ